MELLGHHVADPSSDRGLTMSPTPPTTARFPGCVPLWVRNARGVPYTDTHGTPVVWWIGPPRSALSGTYDPLPIARGTRPAARGFIERLVAFVHGWDGMTALNGRPIVCTPPQVASALQLAPHFRAQLSAAIEQMERDGMVPLGALSHG